MYNKMSLTRTCTIMYRQLTTSQILCPVVYIAKINKFKHAYNYVQCTILPVNKFIFSYMSTAIRSRTDSEKKTTRMPRVNHVHSCNGTINLHKKNNTLWYSMI